MVVIFEEKLPQVLSTKMKSHHLSSQEVYRLVEFL